MCENDINLLQKYFENKNILFVTFSDSSYIRNKQHLSIINNFCSKCKVISPSNKSEVKPATLLRLIKVFLSYAFCSTRNFDLIFVSGLPQFLVPFFSFKDKILIIDFFISLYDTLIEDRKLFFAWFGSIIIKKLDVITLKKADLVIVDTNEHKKYFSNFFETNLSKFYVQYLEADSSIYFPRKIPKPEKYKNKFIVFFFGAMNPLQGVNVIIQAAMLLDSEPKIIFLLVGPYQKILNYEKYSKQKNIIFVSNWCTQEELSFYIAQSDLCLAGHFNADIAKASRVIPGKAFIYLAMGKTIILGDNPATNEIYNDNSKNIFMVPMSNPQALVQKILTIYKQNNYE